jgi:hypothetical protein
MLDCVPGCQDGIVRKEKIFLGAGGLRPEWIPMGKISAPLLPEKRLFGVLRVLEKTFLALIIVQNVRIPVPVMGKQKDRHGSFHMAAMMKNFVFFFVVENEANKNFISPKTVERMAKKEDE